MNKNSDAAYNIIVISQEFFKSFEMSNCQETYFEINMSDLKL